MREIDQARTSLTSLQNQLEQELDKASEQRGELLPKYGLTEQEAEQGQPPVADVPSSPKTTAAEEEARSALERFQKLCRDSRRRAIGS